MSGIGEFEIIEKYFAPLAGKSAFDFKDDAALFDTDQVEKLAITQDTIAEDIHFFADDPAAYIAKKAVRVNLSDLAAKGAKARWISLSLGLPKDWDEEWVAGFAKGLEEDCEKYGLELTGGDTCKTGQGAVISVTAIGVLEGETYVSRLGAKAEQDIYVTGTIGDGALGLKTRSGELELFNVDHRDALTIRYLVPQPRVMAAKIIGKFASAAMDVSDGLIGDLAKLCEASSIGAEIKLVDIPFSDAALAAFEQDQSLLATAITGGDDYEIMCSVDRENAEQFETAMSDVGVPVKKIGATKKGIGVIVLDKHGAVMELENTSYEHTGD